MKKETTKPAAKKAPVHKPAAAKKPRAVKKAEPEHAEKHAKVAAPAPEVKEAKHAKTLGRYIFATGRRKTAVANVRLFTGKGDSTVNRKPFETYFFSPISREFALKPLTVTGLVSEHFFFATINGGGIIAQAQALQHGIAQALASMSPEMHRQLKKNSFLTRDDRKKERKKPGLKRARRSPQWAKR